MLHLSLDSATDQGVYVRTQCDNPASEIACKDKNGLPPGPRFRRVMYVEGGTFPDVHAYKVNMACNHCAEPKCVKVCPTGATYRDTDGYVRLGFGPPAAELREALARVAPVFGMEGALR